MGLHALLLEILAPKVLTEFKCPSLHCMYCISLHSFIHYDSWTRIFRITCIYLSTGFAQDFPDLNQILRSEMIYMYEPMETMFNSNAS